MIDIHSHILPGVDDGPDTVEESIEMARKATEEGIKAIIATPHHKNRIFENPKNLILEKVKELNQRLKQEGIPLTVLPGQEPALNGEILEDYKAGNILTLNETQYVFIELPSDSVPLYTEKFVFDLQNMGVVPIIVHPERNQAIAERPDIFYQLVKKGALGQLTASSICGVFGKNIKNFSLQLLESNLIHFVASDAHNTHNRTFHLSEAYHVIHVKYGSDVVCFFQDNAELMIKGKNIFKEVPQQIRRKKLLGIF